MIVSMRRRNRRRSMGVVHLLWWWWCRWRMKIWLLIGINNIVRWGRGAGMVDCMLCRRRRTRTVYVLRSLKQMVGVVVDGSSWRMSMRSWVGRGGQQNNFTINNRIVNGNGNFSRFLDIRRNNCKVGRIFLGSFMLVLIVFKFFKNC